ncbi:MAG TPA: glycosyltransferase family 4 protein [Candidatus Nanoarchaeia archaeon]|nr:glycosyltransferase family 4 protein [Candidatus Nanoarchaeia archaeon]
MALADIAVKQTQSDTRRKLPKFLCVTNIPTPYRLHFFQKLSHELEKQGWNFEVLFMAKSEPGRYWEFTNDFGFSHRFLPGASPRIGNTVLHFNPSVCAVINECEPEIVMLAGTWFLPTNLMALVTSKFTRRTRVLFWSESHLKSRTHTGRVINALRRRILGLYDGFVVPGAMASEYIRTYVADAPLFELPNTVDHTVFSERVRSLRPNRRAILSELGVHSGSRVLLTPARLIEDKGLLPFLDNIARVDASLPWTLLIAGDGPLRESLDSWCAEHRNVDVRLLGYVHEQEMARLYAAADVFLLPSLRDPNPLSVIEALWAELPLMLSNAVGNHHEALVEEKNGWLFDPTNPDSSRECFGRMLCTSDDDLRTLGRRSGHTAHEFETERVIRRFLQKLGTGYRG